MSIDEIEAKEKACAEGLHALEMKAGIVEAAEKAERGPIFPNIPDAPYGSKQWKAERKAEDKFERANVRRKLRRVYFSVPDTKLRKDLIGKYRECEKLHSEWFQAQVWEAEKKAVLAHAAKDRWWLYAAVISVVVVLGGNALIGISGAIAGGVVAIFWGLALKDREEKLQKYMADEADAELEVCRSNADDVIGRGETFTSHEEWSGEEANLTAFTS